MTDDTLQEMGNAYLKELRDQIAIAALQGMLASANAIVGGDKDIADNFSQASYIFADAMLRARTQRNQ